MELPVFAVCLSGCSSLFTFTEMALPYFYISDYVLGQQQLELEEDTSRHMVSVLRMKKGDSVNLTDGKGSLLTTVIEDAHKKHCRVSITSVTETPRAGERIVIGISLVKNASRFEWFLEKATEMGISEIIPLLCDRTEKERFRLDRMRQIMVSAMLQSQQAWLPQLEEPVAFSTLFHQPLLEGMAGRYIAHCLEEERIELSQALQQAQGDRILLIGPEGDFTAGEIAKAIEERFLPVMLGPTRLRTETAALYGAVLLAANRSENG